MEMAFRGSLVVGTSGVIHARDGDGGEDLDQQPADLGQGLGERYGEALLCAEGMRTDRVALCALPERGRVGEVLEAGAEYTRQRA